jgi:hypothetical protein
MDGNTQRDDAATDSAREHPVALQHSASFASAEEQRTVTVTLVAMAGVTAALTLHEVAHAAGWLPYAIMDGYQQLVRDFATWRVLYAAEGRERDPGKRAWYREDRVRREALILRDMGYLGHYVGDGSQPHHTTIHYNGWNRDTPNPQGFTTSRQTHGAFEGAFTNRVARLDAVEAAMAAPALEGFELRARVPAYLRATLAEVTPFYVLEKAGGFRDSDARGGAFATARLAAGASELRDLFILAWRDSADDSIGWPAVKVNEVEAGTADPWLAMYGED